jgi:hypothetical protein
VYSLLQVHVKQQYADDEMEKCPYCDERKAIKGMQLHVYHKHPEKIDEFKQQVSPPKRHPQ